MKTHRFLPSFLAAALLGATFLLPTATASAAEKTDKAPDLQVIIDVPPTWRPFLEDDVADAFYSHISDTFRRRGFKGETKQLDRLDEPKADIPQLQINLMEWRINRIGNIDCTFSASYKADGKETSLGLFSGTAMQWRASGPGRWALDMGLEDSAKSAISDLYRKLTDKDLLPKKS